MFELKWEDFLPEGATPIEIVFSHVTVSGVTAKGLNGIEAEANKLAKAPKGIDGVTEGTGNVAEDVGKVVETRVVEQLLYMGQMI